MSISDLRANLASHLARAKAGEAVVVTHHGRPVAKLVAATDEDRLKALEAAGIIGPAPDRRPIDPRTRPRVALKGGARIEDIIAEQR